MLDRLRVPGFGGWGDDPLWASFYDWMIEHPALGRPLWRAGLASDIGRLYDAAEEIGRQPTGADILDVPSGGGVALRGLRPGQGTHYVAADISAAMLDRTLGAARDRGVADQVSTVVADVGCLPFDDESFDLVVSFTGLHCFPDPRLAVTEMVRVLRPGGVLTGSALLTGAALRALPVVTVGRLAGLVGRSATRAELEQWLTDTGCVDVRVDMSGAIGYFHATRTAVVTG